MINAELTVMVRKALAEVADPQRAPEMQRYMKSLMPFLGISSPRRREVTKALWQAHAPCDPKTWRAQIAGLWDAAQHREERYAALDWCRYAWAPNRAIGRERFGFHDLQALPLFERLITEGAWWDTVDDLGGHQLGVLLLKYPAVMKPVLREWARGQDLWKRRAAIISQLDLKEKTDTRLLEDCIEPSLAADQFTREFFIRKGIGWALRQYARTNPIWVRKFLSTCGERLPSLSRREAAKHL